MAVVIQESMQITLRTLCVHLKVPQPQYTLHDKNYSKGYALYKYRASLSCKIMGRPPVSLGRYARSEDAARDDAAVLLIRRLLSSTGKKILDYNQRNVELLENQLQKKIIENFELKVENAVLGQDILCLEKKLKGHVA